MKLLLCIIILFCVNAAAIAQNPLKRGGGNNRGQPAGVVADPDEIGQFFPEIARLPPPDWIKPGTRLTYLTSASKDERDGRLEEHPDGYIVDPKTKKRYVWVPPRNLFDDPMPTGGSIFQNIDVVALEEGTAVLDCNGYGFEAVNKTLFLINPNGLATNSGFNTWWVNPEALKQLSKTGSDLFLVFEMPYEMEGHKYRALRIQTPGDSPTAYVYDMDSGVLLRRIGGAVGRKIEGIEFQPSQNIVVSTFKSTRQLKLPWLDQPSPDWVKEITTMGLRGNAVYITPGQGQNPPQPMEGEIKIKARGETWLRFSLRLDEMGAAGVPMGGSTERVSGVGSLSGIWIAPEALQKLRVDQMIDKDPLTGVTTAVTFVGKAPDGRQAVGISQMSPKTRIDNYYDAENGMLKRIVLSWDTGTVQNVKTADVVSAR